jgi:hypothetical protein
MDITVIKNEKMSFKKLGRNVLYFPFYILNNQLISAGSAFIIEKDGKVVFINPKNETNNLTLTRKYPLHHRKLAWLRCLNKGKFQAANRMDFSDAVTLATVKKDASQHFEQISLEPDKEYRYYRFLFDSTELLLEYDVAGASIAEIEFINPIGQIIQGKAIGTDAKNYSEYTPEKCFDGNKLSFFEDPRINVSGKWVGLELEKPEKVSKIRYLARNDMNNVQIGDLYELFYWDNTTFISLGQQIAKDTLLHYNNCPSKAIFWLRNLSGGKEERVFTYENDNQIWW